LEVNQHSENPRVLLFDEHFAAWTADLPARAEKYLAVFNLSDTERSIAVQLPELGFPAACQIRDVWQRADLPGTFSGIFAPVLPAHGAGLYKIKA